VVLLPTKSRLYSFIKGSTVVIPTDAWRRGGSNVLPFSFPHYHPLNPLVLLGLRLQKSSWYEVWLWFDSHQTITKNNI